MPSTSPGSNAASPSPPSSFLQILPGAPAQSLQAFTTFQFRFKRYIAYISGSQLNILSAPSSLVQALTFKHDLVAVAAEQRSGKLAVTDAKNVWLLEPYTEGWSKIWWQRDLFLQREDEGDLANWLSWGDDGEILVAGSRVLTLFSTLPSSRSSSPAIDCITDIGDTCIEERKALWSKSIASSIRQAEFSPSASLIASRGTYDRLVKIWRRLSYEEGLFDYTYLPHSEAVTYIQWRPMEQDHDDRSSSGTNGRHDDDCEVLFTVASDCILRIWRTGGLHDLEILTLYTTINLVAAIPQSPSLSVKANPKPEATPRYVVVLSSEQFCAAVATTIGMIPDEKVSHSRELLKEMISKEPDVIIAFDGQGRMSAWGVQSIGHKRRPDTPTLAQAYHIAHAESLNLRLPLNTPAICGSWLQDDKLHLITHALCDGGELIWWQGNIESVFASPNSIHDVFTISAAWSGHDENILQLQQSGACLISRSTREVTQWRNASSQILKPQLSFGLASDILAATALNSGRMLLTVSVDSFALWDQVGRRVSKILHKTTAAGEIYITRNGPHSLGFFLPSNMAEAVRWSAEIFESPDTRDSELRICKFSISKQSFETNVVHGIPVSLPFATDEDCIVTIANTGTISCALIPDENTQQGVLAPFMLVETGLTSPALFAANEEVAAATSEDGKRLVIVDLTDGYVEYRQFLSRPAEHLACHRSKPRSNFLAVACDISIDILVQGRYDFEIKDARLWHHAKSVSISGLGLKISTMTWMSDGSLAVAAGTVIFLNGAEVLYKELDDEIQQVMDLENEKAVTLPLRSLTRWLNEGALPVWHPNLLSYLLQHDQYSLATTLLEKLAQKLKFWSAGDYLHPTLEEQPEALMAQSADIYKVVDDTVVDDLQEQFAEKDIPKISRVEQQRLKRIVKAMTFLKEHMKGLDSNALRYLSQWKLQLLSAEDENHTATGLGLHDGAQPQTSFVPEMAWREICFAYHSTTQQPLLDILVLQYDNKLTWEIARKLGIMAWLSEREALEQVFEQLGQTSYRSEQPHDPVNASLFYLALHKKQTLLALWRIATWHKEQRSTTNFLKRDFSQSDARTAAKKNAYALMGKRRFHYAAAFFLLAQDPASASSLLAGQCEDTQLAIAVARLYCGDGSPVLQKLLEDRIMPEAETSRDRWQMSWCYSVTLQRHAASGVLVAPLDGIKAWHQDDPLTLLLYQQLRKETSEHEYDAVLRAARILRRMGLWLPALDLVSKWKFHEPQPVSLRSTMNGLTNGADVDHNSIPDGFDSELASVKSTELSSDPDNFTGVAFAQATGIDERSNREAKAAALLAKIRAKDAGASAVFDSSDKKKLAPTQFKEPDPNSLLDSFGF